MQNLTIALTATVLLTLGNLAEAQSLQGSRQSMERQHQEAVNLGYTFIKTSSAVNDFVESGYLVRVSASRTLELHNVSYPYVRPAVKTFVERLSAQYQAACGEKLTVTSLTRPIDRQPANAASDSVHPTGMAVDLRIPSKASCRTWLEKTLLSLEASDVLDVTRERNPPHYHVAVFPQSYETYLASQSLPKSGGSGSNTEYVVRRGDTLSRIASITGSSIQQLRAANGLRNDLIHPGLKLQVPSGNVLASANSTPVAAAPRVNEVATVTEVTHQVKKGDTLWRIARRYGITADVISSHNGLASDFLQIGQTLRITTSLSTQ
ncbi:MAG: DUF5715 family protein [Gammaproteobacteria bacterium]|nr:DUF5715 family protein [Gammaproteobacteria bacterium]MDP2140554.1 DUF5715 family protein [Gammaproteobacteria bacterium]MDP2347323.1 DUF5715 family protein [Gammaproteobacteria bacterium]